MTLRINEFDRKRAQPAVDRHGGRYRNGYQRPAVVDVRGQRYWSVLKGQPAATGLVPNAQNGFGRRRDLFRTQENQRAQRGQKGAP